MPRVGTSAPGSSAESSATSCPVQFNPDRCRPAHVVGSAMSVENSEALGRRVRRSLVVLQHALFFEARDRRRCRRHPTSAFCPQPRKLRFVLARARVIDNTRSGNSRWETFVLAVSPSHWPPQTAQSGLLHRGALTRLRCREQLRFPHGATQVPELGSRHAARQSEPSPTALNTTSSQPPVKAPSKRG